MCAAGLYGLGGSTTVDCSGPCGAGYVGDAGASTSVCSDLCPAGYVCAEGTARGDEVPCGSAEYYCPAGASAPTLAAAGTYTTPTSGSALTRTGHAECGLGTYCPGDGVAYTCPAGYFGSETGLTTSTCSGEATEGFYTDEGATSSTQHACGDGEDTPAGVYCGVASSSPTALELGQISTPYWSSIYTRTSFVDCMVDAFGDFLEYCSGDGTREKLADFGASCVSTLIVPEKQPNTATDVTLTAIPRIVKGIIGYSSARGGSDFTREMWTMQDFELDGTGTAARNGASSKWLDAINKVDLTTASHTVSDGLTLGFWLRPEGFDGTDSTTLGIATVGLVSSGSILCGLELKDTFLDWSCGSATVAVEQPPLYDGSWTHVAVIVRTDGIIQLMINAIVVAQTNTTFTTFTVNSVTIGASPSGATFNGYVDDVAIFGTALFDAEVGVTMAGGLRETNDACLTSGQVPLTIDAASGLVSTTNASIDAAECDEFYATFAVVTPAESIYAEAETYCSFKVEIQDVNDAPVLSANHFEMSILESAATNTEVGDPLLEEVTEADPHQSSVFSIDSRCNADSASGHFGIVACTGQIVTLVNTLDATVKNEYELCVTVTDDGVPPLNDSAIVTVSIINVNDAPDIDGGSVACQVKENMPPGTMLSNCSIVASDPDGDVLAWYANDPYSVVAIDAASGALSTLVELDYEATSQYYGIQVWVSDGEYASDSIYVRIDVIDVNDPPEIDEKAAYFTVDEHSVLGTVFGDAATLASDQDGDELSFTLTGLDPEGFGSFGMTSSGEIFIAPDSDIIDYERMIDAGVSPSWSLSIAVSDSHGASTIGTLFVECNDVNEAPVASDANFSVHENVAIGFEIGRLFAMDPDVADSDFVWTLLGDATKKFATTPLGDGTSALSTKHALDFEAVPFYNFKFNATDAAGLSGTGAVTVTVLDVNEAPVLAETHPSTYNALELLENEPIGSVFLTSAGAVYTLADDTYDDDVGQSHAYTLLQLSDETIKETRVYTENGRLLANRTFDYEDANANDIFIRVRAEDDGSPPMSSSTLITVCLKILDAPEAPTATDVSVTLPDTTEIGSTVAVLAGSDVDVADVDSLVYNFTVVSSDVTGGTVTLGLNDDEIILTASAYNARGTIVLAYQATDSFGLLSNTATATINAVVGLHPPRFEPASQSFSIDEKSAHGTRLGSVNVVDEDSQETLEYYVVGGTGRSLFEINRTTGAISVAEGASLDYETTPSYLLKVSATDGDSTTYSTVSVMINDVQEAPTFSSTTIQLRVLENTTYGDTNQFVFGTDQDAADAESLVYELELPDPNPFEIVRAASGNYGVLRVVLPEALDYETTPTYVGEVTATDTVGQIARAAVVIQLVDVNEPPTFTASTFDLGVIPENTGFFEIESFVAPVDPEKKPLQYFVSSDKFFVTGDRLYVAAPGLDYEAARQHSFTVRAVEESGHYETTATFAVTVADERDLVVHSIVKFDNHSSSVLSTRGGEVVVLTGSDLGPYDDASGVEVRATYANDVDGATYAARNCRVAVPGVQLTCETAAGVGRGHSWNITVHAPGTRAWWTQPALTTSYESPAVTAVSGENLATAGGGVLTIIGSGFGPYCETYCEIDACGDDCVSDASFCSTPSYLGTACPSFLKDATAIKLGTSASTADEFSCDDVQILNPGVALSVGETTSISCVIGAGLGSNLYVQVAVGVDGAPVAYSLASGALSTPVSYEPPTVDRITFDGVENPTTLSTLGGETVLIYGTNLGAVDGASSLAATYGGSDGTKYQAVDCSVITAHVLAQCTTVPGVGAALSWVITRGGLSSSASSALTSYERPKLVPLHTASSALSGLGRLGASTEGGDTFYLTGTNLGPADAAPPIVTYGGPDGDFYAAADCSVAIPHSRVRCTTTEGTGIGHKIVIRVGNQTSPLYPGNLSYSAPFVSYYETSWDLSEDRLGAYAAGGEEVTLHGGNFGPVGADVLDAVFYGSSNENSVEYIVCDSKLNASCPCRVSTPHVAITCVTVPATGVGHTWNVIIDGQMSTAPTTSVEPPEVFGVFGSRVQNASVGGGDTIFVSGRNFGQVQSKLEAVTYGPGTGDEYSARNCTIHSDALLECLTAPGIGVDLKFLATVDGQTSRISGKGFAAYATPVITGVYPPEGDTKGGSVHVINGSNLGLAFERTTLQVLMRGVSLALDGGSTFSAIAGQSDFFFFPCGQLECVRFVLPPLTDTTHLKDLKLRISSLDYESIVLVTGSLNFKYNPPNITTVTNTEGAFYGTSDLVITGTNFGETGEVYIDNQLQVTTSYGHERILLTYQDGTSGRVYVKVGTKVSNTVAFLSNSPRIVTDVAQYAPDPAGYRTSGTDDEGRPRNLTIVGYYLADSVAGTKVLVGGVPALVLTAGSIVEDALDTKLRPAGAVLRSITFMVPAGVGAANPITVFAHGRSNYDANQTSDVLTVRYQPPGVTSISPLTLPTTGGIVTLQGVNFGESVRDVEVATTGGGSFTLEVIRVAHTELQVQIPAGEGTEFDLAISVGGQVVSSTASYAPPTISSHSPSTLNTSGGTLRVFGANFGRFGTQHVTLHPSAHVTVTASDPDEHSWIDLTVGPGQGVQTLKVNVSDATAEIAFVFEPPTFRSLNPNEAPTTGGGDLVISGANFGLGTAYELEFCCGWSSSATDVRYLASEPSCPQDDADYEGLEVTEFSTDRVVVSSPKGQSSAPLTVTLKTCAEACNTATCTTSSEPLNFSFAPPEIYYLAEETLDPTNAQQVGGLYYSAFFDANFTDTSGVRHQVEAGCDRSSTEGCGLRTTGGKRVSIVGANFGVRTPEVWLNGKRVDQVENDESNTHYVVSFVLPQGTGADLPLEVRVGDFKTRTLFSYDPPVVTSVSPNQPDANGAVLQINGYNFGETASDAGEARVTVGNAECAPVVAGSTTASVWQNSDDVNPYLWCSAERTVVGPAELTVHVGHQNTTYPASSLMIEFACADGYYGQRSETPFLTDYGGCYETCFSREDVVERSYCLEAEQSNGATVNCSALTLQDEFCSACPVGSECAPHASTIYPVEPISASGYYRMDKDDDATIQCAEERAHRDRYCYEFVPCSPEKACTGNNTCAKGYTGLKCGSCCTASEKGNKECENDNGDRLLYYRMHGECVTCPTNYILVACLIASVLLIAGVLTYLLKKKRVDVAVVAIGIDYLQVLSLFASADIQWPRMLQDIYSTLSIFNLNFLNVFPPECTIKVPYKRKWIAIQVAPLCVACVAWVVYQVYYVVLKIQYRHQRKLFAVYAKRFRGQVASNLLFGFYFVYLFVAENTLDVLNCSTIISEDGESKTSEEYLMSEPDLVCWKKGHTQYELVPLALIFFVVYVVGYPVVIAIMTLNPYTQRSIIDDQLLRAQGRGGWELGLTKYLEEVALTRARLGALYYRFKPHVPYWIVVVTLRKMIMALITLLFHSSATFQMSMLLLVLFVCFVIQMRYKPYVSPSDYGDLLAEYSERVRLLAEEELQCESAKKIAYAKRRRKNRHLGLADMYSARGREEVAKAVIEFLFEYNTVESTLLGASIVLCTLGTMLDSDYVDNGKHDFARSCLVATSVFVIAVSLAYFATVVWHEIVAVLFPQLRCVCLGYCADDTKTTVDFEDEDLDEGVEYADNPDHAKGDANGDSTLMSVKEQLDMQQLVAKLQEENRHLKHQVGIANKGLSKWTEHVKAKKKDVVQDSELPEHQPQKRGSTFLHPLASLFSPAHHRQPPPPPPRKKKGMAQIDCT